MKYLKSILLSLLLNSLAFSSVFRVNTEFPGDLLQSEKSCDLVFYAKETKHRILSRSARSPCSTGLVAEEQLVQPVKMLKGKSANTFKILICISDTYRMANMLSRKDPTWLMFLKKKPNSKDYFEFCAPSSIPPIVESLEEYNARLNIPKDLKSENIKWLKLDTSKIPSAPINNPTIIHGDYPNYPQQALREALKPFVRAAKDCGYSHLQLGTTLFAEISTEGVLKLPEYELEVKRGRCLSNAIKTIKFPTHRVRAGLSMALHFFPQPQPPG